MGVLDTIDRHKHYINLLDPSVYDCMNEQLSAYISSGLIRVQVMSKLTCK